LEKIALLLGGLYLAQLSAAHRHLPGRRHHHTLVCVFRIKRIIAIGGCFYKPESSLALLSSSLSMGTSILGAFGLALGADFDRTKYHFTSDSDSSLSDSE